MWRYSYKLFLAKIAGCLLRRCISTFRFKEDATKSVHLNLVPFNMRQKYHLMIITFIKCSIIPRFCFSSDSAFWLRDTLKRVNLDFPFSLIGRHIRMCQVWRKWVNQIAFHESYDYLKMRPCVEILSHNLTKINELRKILFQLGSKYNL